MYGNINNNLIEDYCSYEVSKLLKEKGFDVMCQLGYNMSEKYSGMLVTDIPNKNSDELVISRPTIQLAVNWIHENFGIWIYPEWQFGRKKWLFNISCLNDKQKTIKIQEQYYNDLGEEEYNSPQEAYQEAIKYTLENLVK